jgi:hypothetical protein
MTKQPTLKQLTKTWYKKLKDTGFEDIEDTNSKREMLKTWSSRFIKNHTPPTGSQVSAITEDEVAACMTLNEAKAEFYRLAEHFLNSHTFNSKLEKAIWALRSEGASYRTIAKTLSKNTKKIINKDNIGTIVQNLEKLMLEEAKVVYDPRNPDSK